jgi:thiamine biosynthesis lipoprotein
VPFAIQPRRLNVGKTVFVALVLVGLSIWMIRRDPPISERLAWEGFTMGTTYSIQAVNTDLGLREFEALRGDVDRLLEDLNDQMSTYRSESEISLFNRYRSTDSFDVSSSFGKVVETALEISEQTGGAFDPTLDPLINLWGFGDRGPAAELPTDEQISETLEIIGFQHLRAISSTQIQKDQIDLQLNLNAIAKGFGVDAVSDLLLSKGLANSFVEIGGEIYARGLGWGGRPWTVGIETPNPDSLPGESLDAKIEVSNWAVATSGSYRNFVKNEDGRTVSHILDPRVGRPVSHHLASVSVIADSCLIADAIATALFVMGPDEGLQWIESYPEAEALFIVAGSDGEFRQTASSGFAAFSSTALPENGQIASPLR